MPGEAAMVINNQNKIQVKAARGPFHMLVLVANSWQNLWDPSQVNIAHHLYSGLYLPRASQVLGNHIMRGSGKTVIHNLPETMGMRLQVQQ